MTAGDAAGARPRNFKDWFDRDACERLAEQVGAVHRPFDRRRFLAATVPALGDAEFLGRVRLLADALRAELPARPRAALAVLRASLPPLLTGTDGVTDGWLQWPVGELIARHFGPAAAPDALDEAFATMVELTQRFTAEFAVRPFVRDAPEPTFARLRALTGHPSAHVRRWCSEGVRPLLPWGERLADLRADPGPLLPILDALHGDPEEYVRRSVANCLGDVAKDHLDLAVRVAAGWLEGGAPHAQRTAAHALRDPVKKGAPAALALFGYGDAAAVEAALEVAPDAVDLGGRIELRARLTARADARVLVDLVVEYVKANGKRAPKVFKWTTRDLSAGETVELVRTLDLVPRSTRRLYPGEHRVRLQINGVARPSVPFVLRAAPTP